MYPYETTFQWLLATRYQHLVAATEGVSSRLPGDLAQRLEHRRRAIVDWSKVRTVLIVALYFGIISAAVTWALEAVGLGEARGLVSDLARMTAGLAGLFAALFLLANRLLGQLEIDVLAMLALHLPDAAVVAVAGSGADAGPAKTGVRKKRKSSQPTRKAAKKTAKSGGRKR